MEGIKSKGKRQKAKIKMIHRSISSLNRARIRRPFNLHGQKFTAGVADQHTPRR
jgi:hypothetical protein